MRLRFRTAGWREAAQVAAVRLAARTARVNPEQTHRLYAVLVELAGVVRPVTVDTPHVGADVLEHEDGRRFVWMVSQSADPLTVHGYHPPERCPRRLPSKRKRALGAGRSGSVPEHEQPDQH